MKDKFINKVELIYLPKNKRPRYRWITRKREDGRYYGRAPKIGVLIRDLDKKKDEDFSKEQLLPTDIKFRRTSTKNKTKKKLKK